MIIVGLTGGIGSGKTTVAKMFYRHDIPIYIADLEAKKLMNRSKVIRRKLIKLFGDKAYINDELNRTYLADKIFNNKTLLDEMNAIVHPKVASHFKRWLRKQTAPYVIKEVAILFENDSYKSCDLVISVVAPISDRIKRVIERDKTSKEKIELVLNNQWKDHQRIALSNFVITNKDLASTEKQVGEIHKKILHSTQ